MSACRRQVLLFEQLQLSIYLSGLLAERPANLDELFLDHKEASLDEGTSDNADREKYGGIRRC